MRPTFRRLELVLAVGLSLALSACEGGETSSGASAAPTPTRSGTPIVTAGSTPLAAVPAMGSEERANLEDWVEQLNRVDARVADALGRLVKAYLHGDTSTAFEARGDWQAAIAAAMSIRYTLLSPPAAWGRGSSPDPAPSGVRCWGRVAALYASAYAWMDKIADQLEPVLLGVPAPIQAGLIKSPEWAFEDMVANYHPENAGTLRADDIEAACSPGSGTAPPLPPPVGQVNDGIRTGLPTVHGAHAFALIENVSVSPAGVWSSLRMLDAKGKKLNDGFVSGPTVLLDPSQTGLALMWSEVGQPDGWKKALVDVSVEPTSSRGDGALELSPGRSLITSLGLIGVTTVTNTQDGTWCGYVSATSIRDGVAVGGGYEDSECTPGMATRTEVVRLYGKGESTDDLYVRLEMQGPPP